MKMHIRKGHKREPEEVIEEAFGQKLTPKERQKGSFQQQRIEEMRNRINKRSDELKRTQTDRLKNREESWRDRQTTYNEVMKERIEKITNK